MIYTYGITLPGTYHIKKNIVCQDAHKIVRCSDDVVIAAVADGLGSELYTDIASSIAVNVSTSHCMMIALKTSSTEEILAGIKASFAAAQKAIQATAESRGHDLDQYDTTLTLAIMIDDSLYFGHSGDSGIVALTVEGRYEKVTVQQRDDDKCVFPLYFEDKWVFGKFDKQVSSVFLATDGMLETLSPFLIKNEPVDIHIALAQFFMDNRKVCIDKVGESAVQVRMEAFIKNIPDEQVNDDKTVVVLINTAVSSALQPEDYYTEPDWIQLKRKREEEWKRIAYPHLFKEKKVEARKDEPADLEIIPIEQTETDRETSVINRELPLKNNPIPNDEPVAPEKRKGGLYRFLRK